MSCKVCPACGQVIAQDIRMHDKMSIEDPTLEEALRLFARKMGLTLAKQRNLVDNLKPFSTKAILKALEIWEGRGFYTKKDAQGRRYGEAYFVGIVRNEHQKLATEIATGSAPVDAVNERDLLTDEPEYTPEEL